MTLKAFVRLCLLPLAVIMIAFFLLPMARLVIVGGIGNSGLYAYAAILLEPRYRATLINTVLLAMTTTAATLVIATVTGLFLQRHRFPGRAVLIAMLTFPLAFPGVVVGFMIILLAGRQGLIGDITQTMFGDKLVFAYSMEGLFLGYLYFSIPRVILTIMASVERLDPTLEEAREGAWRRRLGHSPRCHSASFGTGHGCIRRNRLRHSDGRLWHRIYTGDEYRRIADADLHRIHARGEHRNGGSLIDRPWASGLGYSRTRPLFQRRYDRCCRVASHAQSSDLCRPACFYTHCSSLLDCPRHSVDGGRGHRELFPRRAFRPNLAVGHAGLGALRPGHRALLCRCVGHARCHALSRHSRRLCPTRTRRPAVPRN